MTLSSTNSDSSKSINGWSLTKLLMSAIAALCSLQLRNSTPKVFPDIPLHSYLNCSLSMHFNIASLSSMDLTLRWFLTLSTYFYFVRGLTFSLLPSASDWYTFSLNALLSYATYAQITSKHSDHLFHSNFLHINSEPQILTPPSVYSVHAAHSL